MERPSILGAGPDAIWLTKPLTPHESAHNPEQLTTPGWAEFPTALYAALFCPNEVNTEQGYSAKMDGSFSRSGFGLKFATWWPVTTGIEVNLTAHHRNLVVTLLPGSWRQVIYVLCATNLSRLKKEKVWSTSVLKLKEVRQVHPSRSPAERNSMPTSWPGADDPQRDLSLCLTSPKPFWL